MKRFVLLPALMLLLFSSQPIDTRLQTETELPTETDIPSATPVPTMTERSTRTPISTRTQEPPTENLFLGTEELVEGTPLEVETSTPVRLMGQIRQPTATVQNPQPYGRSLENGLPIVLVLLLLVVFMALKKKPPTAGI